VTFALSFIIGIGNLFQIKGSAENFFVAGRSLPLLVVVMTLAAQSLDSNSLLGNVDNSYKHSFWDGKKARVILCHNKILRVVLMISNLLPLEMVGCLRTIGAVIPIGLGLSLIINGVFLADKVNMDNVLTLPDIFAKRYGKTVEILVSLATVTSFIMLLAGNLVGIGVITGYLWGINESGGIWIGSAVVWSYTVSGGLFSVAYTDVFQGAIGWVGCLATAYWFITNEENGAPPPSIGFPGTIAAGLAVYLESSGCFDSPCFVLTHLFFRLYLPRWNPGGGYL
jgi:Na+/proline symporter